MSLVNTSSTPAATPVIAFIAKAGDMYACVIDGKQIARSKHQDYFKYHYGRHDVKALDIPIEKFVYLDEAGGITLVSETGNTPNVVMRRQAVAASKIALNH